LKVTNAMLAGSIAASNLVGTDIATLGTVTAGTLSTGAVIAGVTITVGSDATGDLHYRNASGIFTRLGIGSAAQVLTVAGGLPSWAASSGLSGTGAVDNAVLRADGTGGATLQSSAFTIADLATASPNNTVNNVSMSPTGGTTNVSVSIVPKGTGAFCLAVPDGTSAGGNARGANAVDLQTSRTAANQVATQTGDIAIGINNRVNCDLGPGIAIGQTNSSLGRGATIAIGKSNTAGDGSQNAAFIAIGIQNTANVFYATAIGESNTSSGPAAITIGYSNAASGRCSIATGISAVANIQGQRSHQSVTFAAAGDCQRVDFALAAKTTNATPTLLTTDLSSARLTITSGKIMFADLLISGIKSDGSAACCYKRKVAIKNVAGTTSLVGTVETIGTDIEDNAATDVAITADNTNDALQIDVTGIAAETWRWVAVVEGLEIAYGT
jgi:hypothetical protein